jgi:hypothetical protein
VHYQSGLDIITLKVKLFGRINENKKQIHARFRGDMLGLAVRDAMGVP